MLRLDHLTIIAPTLREGVNHVRDCIGIDMHPGGGHPEMGTHNRLLRLGADIFLEVIAVDPEAGALPHRRWFGLDATEQVRADWTEGRRLRGFVARTDDLDLFLTGHGPVFGRAMRVSRGDRTWRFGVRPDGSMPRDGVLPSVIDWGARGCPASAMPQAGTKLRRLIVTHPDPTDVADLHAGLGLTGPFAFETGPGLSFCAEIDTPNGLRRLT